MQWDIRNIEYLRLMGVWWFWWKQYYPFSLYFTTNIHHIYPTFSHDSIIFDSSWPFLQNTPLENLDKKHFAKTRRSSGQNGNGDVPSQEQEDIKELALVEAKMKKLCELLGEVSLYIHSCSSVGQKLKLWYSIQYCSFIVLHISNIFFKSY